MEPFKKEEVELRIKARDFCEETVTDHRLEFITQRAKSERDKDILITLLDTELSAGTLRQRLAKFVMQVREGAQAFCSEFRCEIALRYD